MSTTQNPRVEYPERLSIAVDEQTYDRLRELAETLDRSIAWCVRQALAEYLDKHADQGR